jgi:hypothetical protein
VNQLTVGLNKMKNIQLLCITVLFVLICSCENEVYEPWYLNNTYNDEEEVEKEEDIQKVKVYLSQDNEIQKYISEPWSGRRGYEANFTYEGSKIIRKGIEFPRDEYDIGDSYTYVYSFINNELVEEWDTMNFEYLNYTMTINMKCFYDNSQLSRCESSYNGSHFKRSSIENYEYSDNGNIIDIESEVVDICGKKDTSRVTIKFSEYENNFLVNIYKGAFYFSSNNHFIDFSKKLLESVTYHPDLDDPEGYTRVISYDYEFDSLGYVSLCIMNDSHGAASYSCHNDTCIYERWATTSKLAFEYEYE